jgi:predicted DCC family thiol-disulfide oxidoreductase YuxK
MSLDERKEILLFDGFCNVCHGAVRFILRRERISALHFAPLQSETGKTLLRKYGYPEDYLDGLVLIENQRAHDQSSACLRVAKKLKFPWNLFFIFLLIPKPVRDLFYRIISSLRYGWFGRKDSCSIPQSEDISRFL